MVRGHLAGAPANLRRQTIVVIPLAVRVADYSLTATKSDRFLHLSRIFAAKGQHTAARMCREQGLPLDLAGPVAWITAATVADGSDVVAHSMGGVVAIGLALAYPQKVRRPVLVATSGGIDVGRAGAEDWRAERAQSILRPTSQPLRQRSDRRRKATQWGAARAEKWTRASLVASPLRKHR